MIALATGAMMMGTIATVAMNTKLYHSNGYIWIILSLESGYEFLFL